MIDRNANAHGLAMMLQHIATTSHLDLLDRTHAPAILLHDATTLNHAQELFDSMLRHVELSKELGIGLTPKYHLWFHLACRL